MRSDEREIRALVEQYQSTPGWTFDERPESWRVLIPDGGILTIKKRGTLKMIKASLARAASRSNVQPAAPRDEGGVSTESEAIADPAVIEVGATTVACIEEVLYEDETVAYRCTAPGCTGSRFSSYHAATGHYGRAHPKLRPLHLIKPDGDAPIDTPQREAMTNSKALTRGAVNGVPNGGRMTNVEAMELLGRANRLIESVMEKYDGSVSLSDRVNELERLLSTEKSKVAELADQIKGMQSAARLLMGGTV